MNMRALLFSVFCVLLVGVRDACAISLDPSFGVGGSVSAPFGDVAIDSTGAISIGYQARLLANGQIDPTYTAPPLNISQQYSSPQNSVQLAGGKRLIGGFRDVSLPNGGSHRDIVVARINIDGAIDTTYGSLGIAQIDIGDQSDDVFKGMTVDAAGRLVVSATTYTASPRDNRQVLIRLNANGSRDFSFGGTGKVIVGSVTNTHGSGIAAVGNDVVVLGSWGDSQYVARFDSNGNRVLSFGADGIAFVELASSIDNPPRVLLDSSRRIYVVGTRYVDSKIHIARLLPSGIVDVTYGAGGLVSVAAPVNSARVLDKIVDTQDRLVLVGEAYHRISFVSAASGGPLLIRLTSGGAIDESFAIGGTVCPLAVSTGPYQSYFSSIAIDSAGRYVAMAQTALHRFLPGGTVDLDTQFDADRDGIPNCLERAVTRQAGARDNDIFTIPDLFVMQQYRDFARREATYTEAVNGGSAIGGGGISRAAFIEALLTDPTTADLSGPVTRLYQAYFLRAPDVGGYNFWLDAYQKQNPWTFIGISNFFVISDEFKQRYGSLTNEQFVTLIYRNILNREPDPVGFEFWVNELNSGRRSAGQVMADFSESPENKLKTRGLAQVYALYANMLKRDVDPVVLAEWVPRVNAGESLRPLIEQLLAKPEYRARFLP